MSQLIWVGGEALALRGDVGALEVVAGRVLHGSGLAARRALGPMDDVHQQLLLAVATVTLADEARHSDLQGPDAVEAELSKVGGLRSPDEID